MKRERIVIVLLESIFLLAIGWSILFPKSAISADGGNTDTENATVINAITDEREIELTYFMSGRELEGIMLYFLIDGSADEGKIICEIYDTEKKKATERLEISELKAVKQNSESNSGVTQQIVGTRILFPEEAKNFEGTMRLVLKGDGIPRGTRISLYANSKMNTGLKAFSGGVAYNKAPLYQVLIYKKEYRYTWDILVLCAIFNTVIFLKKEKSSYGKNGKKKDH